MPKMLRAEEGKSSRAQKWLWCAMQWLPFITLVLQVFPDCTEELVQVSMYLFCIDKMTLSAKHDSQFLLRNYFWASPEKVAFVITFCCGVILQMPHIIYNRPNIFFTTGKYSLLSINIKGVLYMFITEKLSSIVSY